MLNSAVLHWRGDTVLSRDIASASARSEFYSRVKRGEFVAIFRGAYVRADLWRQSTPDARYLLCLAAAVQIAPESVMSHYSAAAVWRLPIVGGWPRRAHVLQARGTGDRSTSAFIRHSTGVPADVVTIGEFTVTPLARTVVDVAASGPRGPAIAMADAALRRAAHPVAGLPAVTVTKEDLISAIAAVDLRHGAAKALEVVEFADGAADRPGESMSRVAMSIARVSPPLLQVVLYGASGTRYVVDFWWPHFAMIGEFDGWSKYTDPAFLNGRSPEQAFKDEKRREDDLRAAGYGMTRWEWALALDPAGLRAHLARAGVS